MRHCRWTVALVLCGALAANCATGNRFAHAPSPAQPTVSRVDPSAIRAAASAIGGGTRVRVQLTSGRTLTGTLLAVQEAGLVFKPRTRIPEPAVTVPIDQIESIERDAGIGFGRALAIGAAIGAAAAIAVVFAIVASLD